MPRDPGGRLQSSWRRGCGRCRCGGRISLWRSRRRTGFARLAQDAAPLHLDHDRILAAMAELLLHLAGFDGPLDAQRLAAQNRLVFLAVTHTTELYPSLTIRPARPVGAFIPCSLDALRIGGVMLPMHGRPGSATQIAFQAANSRTQTRRGTRVGHCDMDDVITPHCHR